MRKTILAAACFALIASNAEAANRLDISEYNSLVITSGIVAQIPPEPGLDQAPVDFSGGEAKSAAFGPSTSYIWIMCDTQCSFKIGINPTATTSNKRLPAGTPLFWGVQPGQKISVIASP